MAYIGSFTFPHLAPSALDPAWFAQVENEESDVLALQEESYEAEVRHRHTVSSHKRRRRRRRRRRLHLDADADAAEEDGRRSSLPTTPLAAHHTPHSS